MGPDHVVVYRNNSLPQVCQSALHIIVHLYRAGLDSPNSSHSTANRKCACTTERGWTPLAARIEQQTAHRAVACMMGIEQNGVGLPDSVAFSNNM